MKIKKLCHRKAKTPGFSPREIYFICFQEFVFDNAFWKKKHFVFFDYACKTDSENVHLNSEGQEYKWVSLEEALKLPVEPYTKQTIKQWVAMQNVKNRGKKRKIKK